MVSQLSPFGLVYVVLPNARKSMPCVLNDPSS